GIEKFICIAAVIARNRTQDQPQQKRSCYHAGANQHGDLRAVDHAGKNVAAQFVSPKPVGCAGRLEPGRQVIIAGLMRSNPRRKQSYYYKNRHHHHACCGKHITPAKCRCSVPGSGESHVTQSYPRTAEPSCFATVSLCITAQIKFAETLLGVVL